MRCNNCLWAQDLVCHEPRGSCRWRVLCHAWEGAPQTMIPPRPHPRRIQGTPHTPPGKKQNHDKGQVGIIMFRKQTLKTLKLIVG